MKYATMLRSQFTPRGSNQTWRSKRSPLYLEVLEDRLAPATVRWTCGSGNWNTPACWSTGALPGTEDDVIIDVPADATITHNTGTTTVRSLNSSENLLVLGNTELAISTRFSLAADRSLTADFGTFSAAGDPGSTNIDGATLHARNGGQILLPAATSFRHTASANGILFRSTGFGSMLALPNVTAVTNGPRYGTGLYFWAEQGGTIDFRSVVQVEDPAAGDTRDRRISFAAADPGSRLILTSLQSLTHVDVSTGLWSELYSLQGGVIELSNGPTPVQITNVEVGVDPTATISFGTLQVLGNSHLFGSGTLEGSLILAGQVQIGRSSAETLTLAGDYSQTRGTLTGPGQFTVNGVLAWEGGLMSGTGRTVAAGFLSVAGENSKVLDGRALVNQGAASWAGAGDLRFNNNAVFLNAEDATLDIQGDARAFGTGTVRNAGMLLKSDGLGFETQISVPVQNTGTLQVDAGTLLLNHAAGFTNAGTVNIGAAAVLSAATGYLQMAGVTNLLGGTLVAPNVTLRGGSLTGTGVIEGSLQNEASMSVGGSGATGTITITGDYVQTADGILEMELLAATEHDKLTIGGSATVDGWLSVTLLDGFATVVDDAFELLTAEGGLTGTFAMIDLPDLGEELFLDPQYGANGFTLRTTARS